MMSKRLFTTVACIVVGLIAAFGYNTVSRAIAQTTPTQTTPTQTTPTQTTPTQTTPTQTAPNAQTSPTLPQQRPLPGRPNAAVNEFDRQFVQDAGSAGQGNIELSRLALQRSQTPAVRRFAEAELQEQIQVGSNLRRVAPGLGITVPTVPRQLQQAALTRLSQLSEREFDQAFLAEGGINAHLENAAVYQREVAFGQNPEIIAIANQGLPIINRHFSIATQLTNYRFAQVPQRFNQTSSVPNSNTAQ